MLRFLSESIRNARSTGAICPSSRALARAMVSSLEHRGEGPVRILEVGPGTGAFTAQVLLRLRNGDSFDMVEINELFCDQLEAKHLGAFREAHPGVSVRLWRGPVEVVGVTGTFDHIICGLPFNNFGPSDTRALFSRMLRLLKPGGDLSYFEYVGIRKLRAVVVDTARRRRLREHDAMRQVLDRRHSGRRTIVWPNVPPARVVHLTR